MLAKSASVKFFSQLHGMGGRISRPLPICLPVRRALINTSCDHAPMPVSESGVRFAEKLTPHGPEKAVMLISPAQAHGGISITGRSIFIAAGWPESMSDISGSGPCGPIFHGVWQSLQPMAVTRYLPCATDGAETCVAVAFVVAVVSVPVWFSFFVVHPAKKDAAAIPARAVFRICLFMVVYVRLNHKPILNDWQQLAFKNNTF